MLLLGRLVSIGPSLSGKKNSQNIFYYWITFVRNGPVSLWGLVMLSFFEFQSTRLTRPPPAIYKENDWFLWRRLMTVRSHLKLSKGWGSKKIVMGASWWWCSHILGIVFDLFYRVHYDIDFGRRKEKFLKEIHVFVFFIFSVKRKKNIFGSSLTPPLVGALMNFTLSYHDLPPRIPQLLQA